jgi:hypothetical protein
MLPSPSITVSIIFYLINCAVITLIIRGIMCVWRAFAIGAGEHLDESTRISSKKSQNEGNYLCRFLKSFGGFCGHKNIQDYWLPTIIGFAELVSYPILIYQDQIVIIGGWLAIKTAGQWKGWKNSLTTFNRFLLGNILVLAFSYLWLLRYIN